MAASVSDVEKFERNGWRPECCAVAGTARAFSSVRELVRIGHLHLASIWRTNGRDRVAFNETLRLRSKRGCDLAVPTNADVADAKNAARATRATFCLNRASSGDQLAARRLTLLSASVV